MPTPQHKGGEAGLLGGELQPTARHHRQAADLADHGGDAPRNITGRVQPLLHRPQDVVVARRADQHETAGIEPPGGEARPVKIAPPEAPQHGAGAQPPDDPGGKPGGDRGILLVGAGAEDLVQRAQCQSAARQGAVERRDPERHDAVPRRAWPLEPPDAVVQESQIGSVAHSRMTTV